MPNTLIHVHTVWLQEVSCEERCSDLAENTLYGAEIHPVHLQKVSHLRFLLLARVSYM
jgi:hypothetical protein